MTTEKNTKKESAEGLEGTEGERSATKQAAFAGDSDGGDDKNKSPNKNKLSSKIGGAKKRTASTAELSIPKESPKGKKAHASYQKNADSDDDESDEEEKEKENSFPLKNDDVEPITPDEELEQEYEVQKIVAERTKNGKKEYFIRWKGFKPHDNTWEPANHLNCPELIAKFMKKKKK